MECDRVTRSKHSKVTLITDLSPTTKREVMRKRPDSEQRKEGIFKILKIPTRKLPKRTFNKTVQNGSIARKTHNSTRVQNKLKKHSKSKSVSVPASTEKKDYQLESNATFRKTNTYSALPLKTTEHLLRKLQESSFENPSVLDNIGNYTFNKKVVPLSLACRFVNQSFYEDIPRHQNVDRTNPIITEVTVRQVTVVMTEFMAADEKLQLLGSCDMTPNASL